MKKISIFKVLKEKSFLDQKITICGWIRTKRDSKRGFSFLNVYDGSCFSSLQIIVKKDIKNYDNEVLHLTTGCSVIITGILQKSIGKDQEVELLANKVYIIGWVKNPKNYPVSSKEHSLEYLRTIPHLRSRTNFFGAVSRIRNTVFHAIHNFFNKHEYIWVATPIITKCNSEGSTEMFRLSTLDFINFSKFKDNIRIKKNFFGCEVFLTVSGQLTGESYACSLSKIYTFGPIFRAENSNTKNHLAEFWMVEPEIAFANLDDIIILAKDLLKYIFEEVLNKRIDDLVFFEKKINKKVVNRLKSFLNFSCYEIDYSEAVKILKNSNHLFNSSVFWGMDFSNEHERYLTDIYFKNPIIVKNYPKDIKSFYMRLNKDNKTVSSMDILMPDVGEIIGGSEREDSLKVLKSRIKNLGLNIKNYEWYCDLRKYGTVPHSGFGLGFERLISYITGIKNIRDTIPFPRTPNNIYC